MSTPAVTFTPAAGMTLTCTADRMQSATHHEGLLGETFTLEELLGAGSFGEVWRCTTRTSGEARAIKLLHDSTFPNAIADAEVECGNTRRVLQVARVTNVPDYYGMALADLRTAAGDMVHRTVPLICMEFIDGGCLSSIVGLLRRQEACIRAIIMDIASALERLHRVGIIHNDVKPQNVLVDRCGTSYLCDFGHTIFLGQWREQEQMPLVGSPFYTPPEVVNSRPCRYDEKRDIWALGVTTYEMHVGNPPFLSPGGSSSREVYEILEALKCVNLAEVWRSATESEVRDASAELRGFLNACFQVDPSRRPSAAELFQHQLLLSSRPGRSPRADLAEFMHAHLAGTAPQPRSPTSADSTRESE